MGQSGREKLKWLTGSNTLTRKKRDERHPRKEEEAEMGRLGINPDQQKERRCERHQNTEDAKADWVKAPTKKKDER